MSSYEQHENYKRLQHRDYVHLRIAMTKRIGVRRKRHARHIRVYIYIYVSSCMYVYAPPPSLSLPLSLSLSLSLYVDI